MLWFLAERIETSDGGWIWLLIVPATLAGIAAVWAAVDGVLSARRGSPISVGLLVWLAVAVGTGLLQPVYHVARGATADGISGERWAGMLQATFFYALFVAVPAVLAFGLAWLVARKTAPRTRV
jgi:hypothetical protein